MWLTLNSKDLDDKKKEKGSDQSQLCDIYFGIDSLQAKIDQWTTKKDAGNRFVIVGIMVKEAQASGAVPSNRATVWEKLEEQKSISWLNGYEELHGEMGCWSHLKW